MIIIDLLILGIAVGLVMYAWQLLKDAAKKFEAADLVAGKHNEQVFLLHSRMEGLKQVSKRAIELAKQPCEKCGHCNHVPLL